MNYREFKGGGKPPYFGYFITGLIGAVIGGFLVLLFAPASIVEPLTEASNKPIPVKEEKTVTITTDVSTAASKAAESVVGVITVKHQKDLLNQNNATQGVGSGVIVSKNGYILTNNHVANTKSNSINVMTHDGKEHKAKPIWSDETLDLSVIKIEGENFTPAALGDSKNIMVGEPAIAIGNPLGLSFQRTVTSGIISAVNRTLEIEKGIFMEDLIQTDASINPGNSGGPLVNIKGEVVGINTAKVSTAEGIGFAVPINIAKPIINSIKETGDFKAPYIGITALDREVAGYYNVNITEGIYVVKIDKTGPSKEAGINEGDTILTINGIPVNTTVEFKEAIYNKVAGDTITLKIKNKLNEIREVEVTLK